MASKAPVVEIIDDDDDVPAFTPALPRKRSRATPSTAAASTPPDFLGAFSPTPPAPSSPDFVGAFCPSPIRPWKQRISVTPTPLDDDGDDTPPPPKRRPSAPPIILDDDDDDTPTSPYISETPDNAAAGTPGFTTPRPAGPSSTAPAFSSTGRVPTSSGASCPIPVDSSDDELDDFGSREPFAEFISPCENSALRNEEKHNMEENAQPIKEATKKQERKRLSKEEKEKIIEEKKRQQEERKMEREANKVQQAEQKKLEKQKADWDSGKHALESIVAKIDSAIIEAGAIGGPLLTRFSEKKLTYEVGHNPMRGSILWKMVRKSDQHPDSVSEVPYILFVLQAEEFCDRINSEAFWDHVVEVQNRYPTFTIFYVTNKLMKYINNRKPLTWLSVHAKGVIIPKGFVDKAKLNKDPWFMSLLAIPKVQPRFAHAIWKKYRTMRSLLNVYMDPSKTDREKEVLLKDLKCEDCLGEESRRVGLVCSKRVYRILMAQDGAMEADEAEKS
ncbi:hypothetical protein ACQ4PT_061556 [Festuca glaucescens]